MAYKSNKQKIIELFEEKIIPAIKKQDLDYYKIRQYLISESNASGNFVDEVINNFISMKKIKEIRVLTIPDDDIDEFMELMKVQDRIIKEADKEIEKIEEMSR